MKIQPMSLPKTFGDWAYLAIATHLEKTLSYETDVLKDRDPEALHQMRVGMRRLRTAIAGFAPSVILPEAAQEKQVAKVAKVLGNLRDIDVLQAMLQTHYQPQLPSVEQKLFCKVEKKLRKQRQKALAEVQETLASKRYSKLKRGLSQWLEHPTYTTLAEMPIDQILPDLLLPYLSQLFLQPGWLVGVNLKEIEADISQPVGVETVETYLALYGNWLHDLRKQAKRVRYQMNLFSNLYGGTYKTYEEDLKQLQAVLGTLHDNLVLTNFLTHILGSEWRTKAPHFTSVLARDRVTAWQAWQTLQHRYLSAYMRQAFYLELLQPGSEVSRNGSTAKANYQIEV